jgi:hypothetical protein
MTTCQRISAKAMGIFPINAPEADEPAMTTVIPVQYPV